MSTINDNTSSFWVFVNHLYWLKGERLLKRAGVVERKGKVRGRRVPLFNCNFNSGREYVICRVLQPSQIAPAIIDSNPNIERKLFNSFLIDICHFFISKFADFWCL
ncbi:unnamed protein product [Onchocerca flexuosa]|uniref:Uncharacterized protein n=1 Tax=Onchocerca flexuosa TaxID=387005 RepID=A0A183HB86_9BILA|nr:unnamed protein product [Onchocerca flexuosa]